MLKEIVTGIKAFQSAIYNAGSSTLPAFRRFFPAKTPPNITNEERETITDRSKFMYCNHPLARGIVERISSYAVGTGITLQSRIDYEFLGITKEQGKTLEKTLEREFRWFSTDCDIENESHLPELQRLVLNSKNNAGDVLVNLAYKKNIGSPYGLKVQLIPGERVSNSGFSMDTTNKVGGVHVDNFGAPVAFDVEKVTPAQSAEDVPLYAWTRLRANGAGTGEKRAWLIKTKDFPGQKRGVSLIAPVMDLLKMVDDYLESELVAANNQGNQCLIIKSPLGNKTLGTGLESSQERQDDEVPLVNGAVISLAPGEDALPFDPSRPNSQFEPFFLAIVKIIGASTGLPVEFLLQAFQSSYSAARGSFMMAWRTIKVHIASLNRYFNQPVYEAFVDERIANNAIDIYGLNYSDFRVRKAITNAKWTPPPKGSIDPNKEIQAYKSAVDLRVDTRQNVAEELGNGDVNDIIRQQGYEEEEIRKAKLTGDGGVSDPLQDVELIDRLEEIEEKVMT